MMRCEESRDCGSNCARAVWLLGGALRNTGSEVRRHQQPTKIFLAVLDRAKQQIPGGLGRELRGSKLGCRTVWYQWKCHC